MDAPQKVSEVKRWIADHADADPAVLAPYAGQRAAARSAAVRALGAMGTPGALAVLGEYADESYPDPVLKELHQAWGNFDRRDFAATMFRPGSYTLNLGVARSIEGIGAVSGLTSLDVSFAGAADLSPLAECAGLRTLRVAAHDSPGLIGVDPILALPELSELHLTETTRNADLNLLAGLGVTRLRLSLETADGSFLLRMPRLQRLLLAVTEEWDDATETTMQAERQALAAVVVELVRKGVRVVVYKYQRAWVTDLTELVEGAADISTVEAGGYLGLTNDDSTLETLQRSLSSNLVP